MRKLHWDSSFRRAFRRKARKNAKGNKPHTKGKAPTPQPLARPPTLGVLHGFSAPQRTLAYGVLGGWGQYP